MANSLQNCAPGVFVFSYPESMGSDALGDAYCLVKEQIGDNILVPVPDSCSLERVDNALDDTSGTYILTFPLGEIDIETVNEIFFGVRQVLGGSKLICIPDSMSFRSADASTLMGIKEVVEWRLRSIEKGHCEEQDGT